MLTPVLLYDVKVTAVHPHRVEAQLLYRQGVLRGHLGEVCVWALRGHLDGGQATRGGEDSQGGGSLHCHLTRHMPMPMYTCCYMCGYNCGYLCRQDAPWEGLAETPRQLLVGVWKGKCEE